MGLLDRLRGNLEPASFANAVMRSLRAAGYAGPIEYDAERFALRFGEAPRLGEPPSSRTIVPG